MHLRRDFTLCTESAPSRLSAADRESKQVMARYVSLNSPAGTPMPSKRVMRAGRSHQSAMSGLCGGSTATRACTGSSISRNRTSAAAASLDLRADRSEWAYAVKATPSVQRTRHRAGRRTTNCRGLNRCAAPARPLAVLRFASAIVQQRHLEWSRSAPAFGNMRRAVIALSSKTSTRNALSWPQ